MACCLFAFADQPEKTRSGDEKVRICSFNLRGAIKGDKGVRNWEHRKNIVADFFKDKGIDICGTQESARKHFPAYEEKLSDYAFFGKNSLGEQDGRVINVILYKKDRFELLENNTLWLSSTPEKISKEWGSSEPRTVTYGKFLDKKTKKIFFIFSVHLDHISSAARLGQAMVLFDLVKKIAKDSPFFVMGDFNCLEDSEPIKYVKSLDLVKSVREVSKSKPGGPSFSFHGFKGKGSSIIDYIFVPSSVEIESCEISNYSKDGAYPSDHFPLICDAVVK